MIRRVVVAWMVLWAVALDDQLLCVMGLAGGVSNKNTSLEFRPGTKADSLPIAMQLARELMNPLGVDGERFLVAGTMEQPRIGWAQLRPLNVEAQIQQEADEAAWDAFEADDQIIEIPVGRKSLPWTKEYQDFAQQAGQRREDRAGLWRDTERETPRLYELASVWVAPAFRHQGIGTELVRRTLQRHCGGSKGNLATNVYLLTLASTAGWYREQFGFRLVVLPTDIPAQMAWEVQAGKLITGLIGAELVCMQGTDATGKL